MKKFYILSTLLLLLFACKKKNPPYEDRGESENPYYGTEVESDIFKFIAPCKPDDNTIIIDGISKTLINHDVVYNGNYNVSNYFHFASFNNNEISIDFLELPYKSMTLLTTNVSNNNMSSSQCIIRLKYNSIYYYADTSQKVYFNMKYYENQYYSINTLSFCDLKFTNSNNSSILNCSGNITY